MQHILWNTFIPGKSAGRTTPVRARPANFATIRKNDCESNQLMLPAEVVAAKLIAPALQRSAAVVEVTEGVVRTIAETVLRVGVVHPFKVADRW